MTNAPQNPIQRPQDEPYANQQNSDQKKQAHPSPSNDPKAKPKDSQSKEPRAEEEEEDRYRNNI